MQLWREAMQSALYGPDGFYRRHEPREHFRTSVVASPLFATALARLAAAVDEVVGQPEVFELVDVGAGSGELVCGMLDALPPDLARRVRPVAVDVRPRPPGLRADVHWTSEVPTSVTGLLVAHELLDNVPCDVLERVDGELLQVVVDSTGREDAGPHATGEQRRWIDTWWPVLADGDRVECGTTRDQWWGDLVAIVVRGAALAVDYGHVREERDGGAFAAATLTGYRDGVQVAPVPDGKCDLTAHVAVDSCPDAGRRAGAADTTLMRQREALLALGVDGSLPDRSLAHSEPAEYVRQLSSASAAAELLDPSSLGSFWWLLQSKGVPLPSLGGSSDPSGSEALAG